MVGDPARLAEWFPVAECTTDLDADPPTRHVRLPSGLALDEEVVTVDADLRRFQYRIVAGGLITSHLGTVDVIGDGDGSLVIYSTDAEPDVFALTIGSGSGEALARLHQMFAGDGPDTAGHHNPHPARADDPDRAGGN